MSGSTPSASPTTSASPSASPGAGANILVFSDDFSDPSSGFPTGDFEHQAVRYDDGRLLLHLKTAGRSTWSMRDLRAVSDWPVARVEGTLHPRIAAGQEGYFGLMCGRDNSSYYAGLLFTGGGYVLLRVAEGEASVLQRDETPIPGFDPADGAELRLECTSDVATSSVTIDLWLGDDQVAFLVGPADEVAFRRVGVYAESAADSESFRVHAADVSAFVGLAPAPVGSAPPATPSPTPSDPLLDALLSHIPETIRPTCDEAATEDTGAVVAVTCRPLAGGAATVRYTQFSSEAAMDEVYDDDVATYGDRSVGSSCEDGPAKGPYTIGGEAAGRVMCFKHLSRAWVEWTDERLDILSVAQRQDDDFEALYDWWLDAGPNS